MKNRFLTILLLIIGTYVFAETPDWSTNFQLEDDLYYYEIGRGETYAEAVTNAVDEITDELSKYLALDSYNIDTGDVYIDAYDYKSTVVSMLPEALRDYVNILETYDPGEDDNPSEWAGSEISVYAAIKKTDRRRIYRNAFQALKLLVEMAVEEKQNEIN